MKTKDRAKSFPISYNKLVTNFPELAMSHFEIIR